MNSSTFTTMDTGSAAPDPRKHVKYTQGMVLGVDDFTQEFAYLSHRDQWLARDLIGYGTVSGLQVGLEPKDGDLQLSVSPGVAVNPRGQFIRVEQPQCARLGAWLQLPETKKKLQALGLNSAGALTAYVVLCYRDCPTDDLPVPGEPCRCDDQTTAPSRILDDFRLELTLEPPPQREEVVVRAFVAWLRGLRVVDDSPALDLETFLQAIRDAFTESGSPPMSPPEFFLGSPPIDLHVPRAEACDWMRAAMRLWVTELRPRWQAQCAPRPVCGCAGPCGCHGTGAEPEGMACECLLLAAVDILPGQPLAATLDESQRPLLVHLRMLQELLACGPCLCGGEDQPPPTLPEVSLAGDVIGLATANVVVGLQGKPVDMGAATPAQTLLGFDGGKWHLTPLPPAAAVPIASNANPKPLGPVAPGTSKDFSRADHVHPVGNFVEHPEKAGPYAIVAAGILQAGGKTVSPSYNQLHVVSGAPIGTVKLAFDGFNVDSFYIIKGTSFKGKPAPFHVFGIDSKGFTIQANNTEGLFMIEVSQFFK